jgi:hypothetical protein
MRQYARFVTALTDAMSIRRGEKGANRLST